jgi:hypothetical protein
LVGHGSMKSEVTVHVNNDSWINSPGTVRWTMPSELIHLAVFRWWWLLKKILKTPTWAEGRKQTTNWVGHWVFSFSWQQAGKSKKDQYFASPKPAVQTQFLVGLISKICVQNVYQMVINCDWNKIQFQSQYQTIPKNYKKGN